MTSIALALAVVFAACSDDELTLTEYVEQVNAAAVDASTRGAELTRDAAAIEDFSPQDVTAIHERALTEIRGPLQAAVDEITPPDEVADLHTRLWDWHAGFIEIEQALAAVAGEFTDTDAGWTAFSNSPEVAAYRRALADGKAACDRFQSELDATADRGIFVDTPWLPGELKEIVVAALGCESFPDDPASVYRYPPTSNP